jgi:hypothetical protein
MEWVKRRNVGSGVRQGDGVGGKVPSIRMHARIA